jgi:hypothetical protein
MKQSIGFCQFTDKFRDMGRKESFTYDGLKALYDYLEQYGEDCGQEVELDVIALCVEYTEYEDLAEFHANYDKDDYPDIDTIRDNTQVIEIDGTDGFIILDF